MRTLPEEILGIDTTLIASLFDIIFMLLNKVFRRSYAKQRIF